jgi:hypothetical protein
LISALNTARDGREDVELQLQQLIVPFLTDNRVNGSPCPSFFYKRNFCLIGMKVRKQSSNTLGSSSQFITTCQVMSCFSNHVFARFFFIFSFRCYYLLFSLRAICDVLVSTESIIKYKSQQSRKNGF